MDEQNIKNEQERLARNLVLLEFLNKQVRGSEGAIMIFCVSSLMADKEEGVMGKERQGRKIDIISLQEQEQVSRYRNQRDGLTMHQGPYWEKYIPVRLEKMLELSQGLAEKLGHPWTDEGQKNLDEDLGEFIPWLLNYQEINGTGYWERIKGRRDKMCALVMDSSVVVRAWAVWQSLRMKDESISMKENILDGQASRKTGSAKGMSL